jgi:hypothetical protein
MSSEPVRFQFRRQMGAPCRRPLVWLSVENGHDPGAETVRWPALLDTGADSTMAPRSLCPGAGHVFEAGTSPSFASGVGAGKPRTFQHAMRINVLAPTRRGVIPPAGDTVFSPSDLSVTCIDQHLPFILLGQADFLKLFEYTQNRSEWWFSLRQL